MAATPETETADALAQAEERLLATTGIRVARHDVTVNGGRIHYLTAGEGEPLVLVHGRGTAGALFAPVLAQLAAERQVIALDLPGWGLSAKPPFTGHTAEDALAIWRGGLLGLLDALTLDQVDLLGHSMGGLTVLGLALEHPERVRRLVLVDSGGLGTNTPLDVRLYFRLKPERLNRWFGPRFLAWTLRQDAANPPREGPLFDFWYAVMSQPEVIPSGGAAFDRWVNLGGVHLEFRRRLRELAMPVLLVWGDHDRLIPVSSAITAARAIKTGRLSILSDAGHAPFLDRPEAFSRTVTAWLDGYGAPPRV